MVNFQEGIHVEVPNQDRPAMAGASLRITEEFRHLEADGSLFRRGVVPPVREVDEPDEDLRPSRQPKPPDGHSWMVLERSQEAAGKSREDGESRVLRLREMEGGLMAIQFLQDRCRR